MSRTRKTLLACTLLVAVLAGAATLWRVPIAVALLQQLVQHQAGRDRVAALPDGLHLALCGTGSPFPDPTRAGPCSAIVAGGRIYIVDAGEGSARNLAAMGLPAARIEAVFLTHFHSDHIDGLPPFLLQRWGSATATTPTPVYGPPGVEQVVAGFRTAYGLDAGSRVSHHGPRIMPPGGSGGMAQPFELPASGQTVQVLARDGLTVSAFRVHHAPADPAVGYRFDYRGRSVVISGDTVASPGLAVAARGADILVHEALQPHLLKLLETELDRKQLPQLGQIMRDILSYHTTPEQAAQIATQAGVGQLVFNHVVPPLPLRYAHAAFVGDAARHYAGPITVGEDGLLFSLPVGGGVHRETLF